MSKQIFKDDILVIVYPTLKNAEKVIILDPYNGNGDAKIFNIENQEQLKELLKRELPFCDQNHEPMIHMSYAYVLNWLDIQPSSKRIKYPEDIDKVFS